MTNGNEPINVITHPVSGECECNGLTKREYFAAMALQGVCSVFSGSPNAEKQAQKAGKTLSELIAIYSIDIADAMIDSLNQQENG